VRLLFVIENLEPHHTGGGYYALFRFAEFLCRRGHEAVIYAVNDVGWGHDVPGLSVVYRMHVRRRGPLSRRLDAVLARVCERTTLRACARRLQPDWVLGVLTRSAVTAAALGRELDVPVAQFVYETPRWLAAVHGQHVIDRASPQLRRLWAATGEAYRQSAALIPNSELAGDYCREWLDGGPVTEPAYPGIDPDEMALTDAGEHRKDDMRAHILYVGRLASAKNVDTLIAAVQQLGEDVVLDVVGSGECQDALQQQAAGDARVVFHGFVDDPQLWQLFRRCTLVCFPSSFEGFGMPPMQALYFRKCCVATDLPVFRSIYGDHLEYVPERDVEALAATLRQLLADPEYRARRGAAGHELVASRFTWAQAAATLEQILER
jgi:glycosyltransferase involved in cell wall biosynthesis